MGWHAASERSTRSSRWTLAAAAAGNFVEWLDFALYGYLATAIAATFFPPADPVAALLGAFAVYGVAFLARPLGVFVFGLIGDRTGRRAALATCVILMGASTASIAIIPSYATIGVAAPLLLLVCRLAEGFSAGGDYAGGLTFTIEHAPGRSRALWTNFVASFANVGNVAGIVIIIVIQTAAPQAYTNGAWRWTFFVAGLIAVVGLLLRLRADETPVLLWHVSGLAQYLDVVVACRSPQDSFSPLSKHRLGHKSSLKRGHGPSKGRYERQLRARLAPHFGGHFVASSGGG